MIKNFEVIITFLSLQSQNKKLFIKILFAEVAQLVEHNLAKVGVAGSNLVFRSKKSPSLG
jgi:hypothetical protein